MNSRVYPEQFFQRFLDPHKPELAEWGAQVGYWGGDRAQALARVSQIAEAAISKAGLGSSTRWAYSKARLDRVESLQESVRSRIWVGFGRLTGSKAFSSSVLIRRVLECLVDIAAIVFLPLFLIAMSPYGAMARWSFYRAEERESGATHLKESAKIYLGLWFEIHADRGELAARIKRGNPGATGGRSVFR